MTIITATKARENIYQLIQDVNASCTPVTITNTREKIQLFRYNSLSRAEKHREGIGEVSEN